MSDARPGPVSGREAELHAEIWRRKQDFLASTREFEGSLRTSLDAFRQVRRDPVGNILAAVSGGVLLSALGRVISPARNGKGKPEPAEKGSWIGGLAGLLPTLAPALLSLLKRRE